MTASEENIQPREPRGNLPAVLRTALQAGHRIYPAFRGTPNGE